MEIYSSEQQQNGHWGEFFAANTQHLELIYLFFCFVFGFFLFVLVLSLQLRL